MKSALNIRIVEDSLPLRTRLVPLLTQALPGSHIGEAGDGPSALALFGQVRWAGEVLDISLPGDSGLVMLDRLLLMTPRLPVIMCSTQNHPAVIRECLRRGACGFVGKHEVLEMLVPTLQSALADTTEPIEQDLVTPLARPSPGHSTAGTHYRRAAIAARDDLSPAEVLAALQHRVAATHRRAIQACQRAKAVSAAVEHRRRPEKNVPPHTNLGSSGISEERFNAPRPHT